MSDLGRDAIGRVQARQSRKPAKGPKARKKRLEDGRAAAENLIRGTIARNRMNQTTDSNNE